jgi:hypothetical protein
LGKPRQHDEWLRDIDARQRSAVFPETAANEARFWRNLIEGKQKLTPLQTVGLLLTGLTALALVGMTAGWANGFQHHGFSARGLLMAGLYWVFAFGILFGFLAVFTLSIRVRRSHNSRR